MSTLNVAVVDQAGAPVADQLVTINTFNALDWAHPGIEINPNPRRTGPDGLVNFYSGPPLGGAIMVQATAQNGACTAWRSTPRASPANTTTTRAMRRACSNCWRRSSRRKASADSGPVRRDRRMV